MKYKIGDRVAVYSLNIPANGSRGTVEVVCTLNGLPCLEVRLDNKLVDCTVAICHPKQCRKLKKKL